MSPDEVIQQARARYNAIGDTFFSPDELYNIVWQGQQIMSIEAQNIEDVQTTTSVVGQREYAKPTNCISIKRVTYDGMKLIRTDFDGDDAITAFNETTSQTGIPLAYEEWGETLMLRPTPSDTKTVKVYFFARPQQVTSTSSLDIREEYQMFLVDYLLQHMFGKDGKNDMSAYHLAKWDANVKLVKGWEARKRRSDSAAGVKNVDTLTDLRFSRQSVIVV